MMFRCKQRKATNDTCTRATQTDALVFDVDNAFRQLVINPSNPIYFCANPESVTLLRESARVGAPAHEEFDQRALLVPKRVIDTVVGAPIGPAPSAPAESRENLAHAFATRPIKVGAQWEHDEENEVKYAATKWACDDEIYKYYRQRFPKSMRSRGAVSERVKMFRTIARENRQKAWENDKLL